MLHPLFQQCSGDWLCEPSGISQLDDGPVLIVNDTVPEKALFAVGISALPEVRVSHTLGKVTHDAARGCIYHR